MPQDVVPLHEKVFQIKAAIRKAGFVASGRVRMDKRGRVIMGVIVPVAFDTVRPSVDDVMKGLSDCVAALTSDEEVVIERPMKNGRPVDLRSKEGRAWRAAQMAEAGA